jgi:predicted small metal-binding protein
MSGGEWAYDCSVAYCRWSMQGCSSLEELAAMVQTHDRMKHGYEGDQ